MNYLDDVQKIDLDLIPRPDYSHLTGVRVVKTIMIKLSDIHVDDVLGNATRLNGTQPKTVEDLKMSFSKGIKTNEAPPAVVVRKGDTLKLFDLVYGFHRYLALMALNVEYYFFTVLEFENESVKKDTQISENEGYAKLENSEIDIKTTMSWKINNGYLKNDESDIRAELVRICTHRKKQSIDRIVQMVVSDCDTPQPYQFYGPSKVKLWLQNHSSLKYNLGTFDEARDMYGFLVKEGYQYRFVMNAIRNYATTGKRSYCVVHVGSPGNSSSIEEKRIQFVEHLNEHFDNLCTSMKKNPAEVDIWEIAGFLPQIVGVDDWKKLIYVDEL